MKRKEKKRKSTPRYVLWRTWMLWKTENFPQGTFGNAAATVFLKNLIFFYFY
jgi:hypothetical protein